MILLEFKKISDNGVPAGLYCWKDAEKLAKDMTKTGQPYGLEIAKCAPGDVRRTRDYMYYKLDDNGLWGAVSRPVYGENMTTGVFDSHLAPMATKRFNSPKTAEKTLEEKKSEADYWFDFYNHFVGIGLERDAEKELEKETDEERAYYNSMYEKLSVGDAGSKNYAKRLAEMQEEREEDRAYWDDFYEKLSRH